jgi:hypothetical protein
LAGILACTALVTVGADTAAVVTADTAFPAARMAASVVAIALAAARAVGSVVTAVATAVDIDDGRSSVPTAVLADSRRAGGFTQLHEAAMPTQCVDCSFGVTRNWETQHAT